MRLLIMMSHKTVPSTLLANGKMGGDTEVTSGGLAFTADSIYVGAGAFKNGNMKMYVSRYANQ